MSWLGKLFGGSEATTTIIDQTFGLIDKSFYTKQEQGEALAKAESEARQMTIEWLQSTSGSRLARRVLAFMITSVWLFMFLLSTFASIVAIWSGEINAENLREMTAILDGRIDTMTPAVMLILGFYFAAPYMGDMARGALERLGGKK